MNRLRLIAFAGLAGAALFGVAGPAAAAPPQHLNFPLNDSFSFDNCGFVVDVVQTGTLHITLWRNSAGLVTRERDGFSSFRQTFSNQDTGDSFSSVRSETIQTDYGSGAVLGSSATVTFTGKDLTLPDVGPDAGRVVLTGTVVGFDPDLGGVPTVDVGEDQEPLFLAGRHPDPDVCAALR